MGQEFKKLSRLETLDMTRFKVCKGQQDKNIYKLYILKIKDVYI